MPSIEKTAGIIIVGDEILSGRVVDINSPFLIGELSNRGVCVRYCLTVPDDRAIIADAVGTYSSRVNWLFTVGGIGPTHDDVTMEGIGKAFDVPVVVLPELEEKIRSAYGERFRPEHLKMARVPDGTKLVAVRKPQYPVARFRNVFVLPGVPELLKVLFLSIEDLFRGERLPFRELVFATEEGIIASILQVAVARHPGVKIGSYPSFRERSSLVKLIVEHESRAELDRTVDFLKDKIGGYIPETIRTKDWPK